EPRLGATRSTASGARWFRRRELSGDEPPRGETEVGSDEPAGAAARRRWQRTSRAVRPPTRTRHDRQYRSHHTARRIGLAATQGTTGGANSARGYGWWRR